MFSKVDVSQSKCDTEQGFAQLLTSPSPGEEVVISGMSGQFPDSRDIYHLRDNLYNKVDMISNDNRRWENVYPGVPQRNGKIFDIEKFDPGFFGVHHSYAKEMEPMLRLLLERSVEAIVDAGVNPSELEGTRTGIYSATIFPETEKGLLGYNRGSITEHMRSMIANTLSYHFKLTGPSCITDTACSSSLVALEHAFKDIRTGKVDMALVCACSLILFPLFSLQFAKLGVLSPDGRCKVFDQAADGYVRSEATVCVFLQKAKNARRIYAQIVHAKTNVDGYKSQNITFPSREMQKNLLRNVYHECKLQPNCLSFLESHGTGTVIGDFEELSTIQELFCQDGSILVGSVKSNLGHTEGAAGLCSVVKCILSYENELIPPNLHYQTPREGVEALKNGRLQIITEKTPFRDNNGLIGINSFGFGGSNAHVLLRWHQNAKINKGLPQDDLPRLVCVSGRLENSEQVLLNDLSNRILDKEFIRLCQQVFSNNLSGHYYRSYIILSKSGEVKRSDSQWCESRKKLALHFTSFGKSWSKLVNILRVFSLFLASVQRIHDILLSENINITDIVLSSKPSKNGSKFDDIIGNAVLQIAIANFLKNLEINCDFSFGTGAGKYICRYLVGSLDLKETVVSVYKTALKQDCVKTSNSKIPELAEMKRGSVILEVGNNGSNISSKRYHFLSFGQVETGLESFFDIFGKLYQYGHNFCIDRFYPEVKYPVSRGTPMLSPLLKWDHRGNWFKKFDENVTRSGRTFERCIAINLSKEEWSYIDGHVVDGRNLFPATGYIDLVWETFSMLHQHCIKNEMNIVMENIKFLRATTVPKNSTVELTVMIQRGSGKFEVTEHNSLVVSGIIKLIKKDSTEQINLALPLEDESEHSLPLTSKDVYKELRLRGYNYKGAFRRIVSCDGGINKAIVNWDSNWITFLDNMLQLKILHMDSRSLFVPTEIKKLIIDGRKHVAYAQSFGTNPDLPVYIYRDTDIIKCGAIEIRGLIASSILRRKPRSEPVLEKYQFVPNETELNINDSVRVIMQLVLENLPATKVKVTEVRDDATVEDTEILSSIIHEVLSDLPLIRPSLSLLTRHAVSLPNVTVEDKKLVLETDCNLVIGSDLCQNLRNLNQAFAAVIENGFVLSREHLNVNIKEEDISGVDIVSIHTIASEKLYLLRKNVSMTYSSIVDITGSNEGFLWLESLQNAVKQDPNVIVMAQNEPLSGILGLVNCIRREPGCSNVKTVFTFKDTPPFDVNNPFYSSQLKKNLSINIYKNGKWGTYRHLLLDEAIEVEREHCFANVVVRGDLSSLRWLEGPLTQETVLPPEKDLVRVYYSSLNFKDVMIASGRISADVFVKDRRELEFVHGFEFSGKTTNGKRVFGIADGALATLLTSDRYLLWPCPDFWSLEDAATVPVVYSTVYYAFLSVCDIRKGKSILIHSGSGGVGQAAINVALHYGLTVYTTVGTKEKREFLKRNFPQLADNRIGNSRDTSFEQMILRETEGKGVDFVLNSLAEEKLLASVRCLAPGGHFMEIGKFDLVSDNELSLNLLEKGATYHGVMLDKIFSLDPTGKKVIKRLILEGMENGAIKPFPRTVFQKAQIEEAFRYMAAGKHIGKVLIKLRNEDQQNGRIREIFTGLPRYASSPNHVQIIIGGLGGFGLELADWLVLRGANNLVLTSRKDIKTGYQSSRIKIWRSYGVRVHISTSDITTKKGCEELIEEATGFGPVESIFNLAVILKDGILENQTVESFRQSFEAKAFATKHLDEITRILCPNLRDFVVFSSVSCGRGNAGQTNYGMSNSMMERICEDRREAGFPALAIQWGAVGDVGLVAELQEEDTELEIGGTLQQRIASCLHVLDTLLIQKCAVVSSMVVAEKREGLSGSENIVESVAQILGIKNLKTVSPHVSLPELGMDSMTAVEIKQILEREYSVFLTPTDMRKITFARLAEIQGTREDGDQSKKSDEALEGFDMFLRAVVDEETSKIQVLTLKSKVEEQSRAPNIIFFPGIEGVAKSMAPLALNLDGHVKCLQYLCEDQCNTIPEMARALLPTVENLVSKTEPFNIIAYSYGASIALEIVSMLEAKGYFGNFFAIDGSPDMLEETLKNNLDVQSESIFETAFLVRLCSIYMPAAIRAEYEDKILSHQTFEERMEIVEEMIPKNSDNSPQYLKALIASSYRRLKALIGYKVTYPKIKSSAMLLKPQHSSLGGLSVDYNLSKIFEKPVDIRVFGGNHVTLLGNAEMAEAVNRAIASNLEKC